MPSKYPYCKEFLSLSLSLSLYGESARWKCAESLPFTISIIERFKHARVVVRDLFWES